MKLIEFDCFNLQTGDKLTFDINPNQVACVSSGTLPSEIVSSVPTEATVIMLSNGQTLCVKNSRENVIKRLKG